MEPMEPNVCTQQVCVVHTDDSSMNRKKRAFHPSVVVSVTPVYALARPYTDDCKKGAGRPQRC